MTNNYLLNPFDLFDPDRTSAGAQWYLRDQVATLYSLYRGVSTEISWDIAADTGQSVMGVTAGPLLWASATPSTTFQIAASLPLAQTHACAYGAPNFKGSFRANFWDVYGITKTQYEADNSYLTAIGSSPATISVFQFTWTPLDGTSTPAIAGCIRMRTKFVLYEQVMQAMS